MTRFLNSIVFFAVFMFVTHFGASAQAQSNTKVNVTPLELRQLAANAVVSGAPEQGYRLASVLLQRNPNDTEALIIRARAARDLGRVDEAVNTARSAWRLADTSSERFGASMVMAQALSSSGAKTRAQLWLRRAAQNAPSDDFKNIAVRDFRYVQRTNPWSTELSFSASPSSNINNGSARSTTRLFDLPFEFQLSGSARALSGIQYNFGFATRYRLSENERSQNDLLFRFDHRTYSMSKEAKLLAPNTSGSDFAFTSASLSYLRRGFSGAGSQFPNQIELTAGRTFYGQAPFMQYARVGFTQNYVFSPGNFAFAGLTAERQDSLSNRADADSWTLNTGVRLSMANRDQLTLSLTGKRSKSIDVSLDYDQLTIGARYALAKPIAGVSVDFGLSLSQKDHDLSRFSRFGRQDKTASLDVTGVFNQIEVYGFSPSVTFSARQTNSNIGLFETRDFGLRVGIQSAF